LHQPVLRSEVLSQVEKSFNGKSFNIQNINYSMGNLVYSYDVNDQTIPAEMVTKLFSEKNNFSGIGYNGYQLQTSSDERRFNVALGLTLNGDVNLGINKRILKDDEILKFLENKLKQETTAVTNTTDGGDK